MILLKFDEITFDEMLRKIMEWRISEKIPLEIIILTHYNYIAHQQIWHFSSFVCYWTNPFGYEKKGLLLRPARPDVRIKSGPIFLKKSCPKSIHNSFYLKTDIFQKDTKQLDATFPVLSDVGIKSSLVFCKICPK